MKCSGLKFDLDSKAFRYFAEMKSNLNIGSDLRLSNGQSSVIQDRIH